MQSKRKTKELKFTIFYLIKIFYTHFYILLAYGFFCLHRCNYLCKCKYVNVHHIYKSNCDYRTLTSRTGVRLVNRWLVYIKLLIFYLILAINRLQSVVK